MPKDTHNGHRKRLKKRFLEEGLDSFEKHNVLELLLFYGIARIDTNEIAHNLMESFGSLSGIFDAPYEELLKVNGIGESAASLIKLIPEISRVYMDDKCDYKQLLNTTEKMGAFLLPKFVGRTTEVVYLICLDNSCKILNCTVLFEGTVNAANISIRKIIETAIKFNASNVILAHNHPTGVALPSNEDLITTDRVVKALKVVGINLLDHIIVARNDFISFADSGHLASITGCII